MTTRKKSGKSTRHSYPTEYKREAVKLAEKLGVGPAARELGLQSSQLYNWRAAIRRTETASDAESRLLEENARLKRRLAEKDEELALLKKASAYFARNQK